MIIHIAVTVHPEYWAAHSRLGLPLATPQQIAQDAFAEYQQNLISLSNLHQEITDSVQQQQAVPPVR